MTWREMYLLKRARHEPENDHPYSFFTTLANFRRNGPPHDVSWLGGRLERRDFPGRKTHNLLAHPDLVMRKDELIVLLSKDLPEVPELLRGGNGEHFQWSRSEHLKIMLDHDGSGLIAWGDSVLFVEGGLVRIGCGDP